nr:cytochrome P450 3045C6-3 [Brachionus rubens]
MNISIDSLSIFQSLLILLLTLIVLYLGKVWLSYRFFKTRGLKTPKYEFFFGNFRELMSTNNYSEILQKWTKTYGKTFGYYEGHHPVIVTSDLDFIQQVFVKQASNFNARKKAFIGPEEGPDSSLFESTKGRWKRMRMVMNPTFSSSKLRELGPLIDTCADRLIDRLNKADNTEIAVSDFYKRFTMDSIWNCAFGVDTNIQYEKENEYFTKCESIFRNLDITLPGYLGAYFHEFKRYILKILMFLNSIFSKFIDQKSIFAYFWLKDKVSELVIMHHRVQKKDYIQLLLDAQIDQENFNYTQVSRSLTIPEIQSNLVIFMLAGYETTSTTLTYATYVLATHLEEQIKLYEEIKAADENLPYLDNFIKEVLRMYPIANSVIARRCTEATCINGIDIPEDVSVVVDVLSLHYDVDLWGPVDPNVFYPERHEVKRNPLCFMSFGNGPRNCIGMKFAMKELRMALVKLLSNFEILQSDETKLEISELTVRAPKNHVKVIFKKRN